MFYFIYCEYSIDLYDFSIYLHHIYFVVNLFFSVCV